MVRMSRPSASRPAVVALAADESAIEFTATLEQISGKLLPYVNG